MKEQLKKMEIKNREELVKHINNYSNEDEEPGKKNTGFDEDILILLDISTIFLKMKDILK